MERRIILEIIARMEHAMQINAAIRDDVERAIVLARQQYAIDTLNLVLYSIDQARDADGGIEL